MYGFWIILIGYAMSLLVLVYTYQFDKFPEYWTSYLWISVELYVFCIIHQNESNNNSKIILQTTRYWS